MSQLEDPQAYIGNPAFHQVIQCPRTASRVSFSEAGPGSYPHPLAAEAENSYPVLFYCLPSVPSRYIAGPSLKLYAERYGVRVVAIDRPGAGGEQFLEMYVRDALNSDEGTECCELKDRIQVSSDMTQSVLEYLKISPEQVSLLCHSAGIIYALDLLARSPFFSSTLPSLYATSPWAPTTLNPLRFIPSPLVTNSHILIPKIYPLLQGMAKSFAFSAALLSAASPSEPWLVPEQIRPQTEAKYRPLQPYHLHHSLRPPKQVIAAIEKAMFSEPMKAMSEEYTLCLDRGGANVNQGWYEQTVRTISERSARQGKKLDVEVFWALNDGIISKKGRDWFDSLLGMYPDTIGYDAVPIEGAAHDDPALLAETVGAVFEQVRKRWMARRHQ